MDPTKINKEQETKPSAPPQRKFAHQTLPMGLATSSTQYHERQIEHTIKQTDTESWNKLPEELQRYISNFLDTNSINKLIKAIAADTTTTKYLKQRFKQIHANGAIYTIESEDEDTLPQRVNGEATKTRNVEATKAREVEAIKARDVEAIKARDVEATKAREVEATKAREVKATKASTK